MILKVLKWDRICQLLEPVVWDSRGPCLLLTEKERLCVAMRAHKSPEAQDKGFPRDGKEADAGFREQPKKGQIKGQRGV